ncbi:TetR/AcrR family transcriptional regulator [Nocardia sp. SC052]|uniref:TetR/AcrR family transcriptional regulator n=1 Tax=Nocardia sichangensis TaxID=3385975 RepID=UPI0039A08B90
MTEPTNKARQRLLEDLLAYMRANGTGDMSLRQLATAIGTSHRMLIYHFESKTGVLISVVDAIAQRERRLIDDMFASNNQLPVVEQLRAVWHNATSTRFLEYARLFFELYGQALHGRAHTARFLDGEIERWLEPLTGLYTSNGLASHVAGIQARLTLATIRGLLLDLLATGDREAVDLAFQHFLGYHHPCPEAD